MLPKLRIILVAVLATCAAVLALSAGMLGARTPGDDLSGVPELSRMLVRQAIVADPDPQQYQVLAYSRRADELLRLRDLPVTPVRAVVDYAEHAQASEAARTSAPAAPRAPAPTDAVAAPSATPSQPVEAALAAAPTPPATAEAPARPAPERSADMAPARDAAPTGAPPPAASPTRAPPVATIAMAPVANPPGDITAAMPAPPASPARLTAVPAGTTSGDAAAGGPAAAPAEPSSDASRDIQIATVRTGESETAEMYGPQRPEKTKSEPKPRHHAKVAHPHPPKPRPRTQVAVAPPGAAPIGSSTPAAATGYPLSQSSSQPNNRTTNTFGGWRSTNDTAAR